MKPALALVLFVAACGDDGGTIADAATGDTTTVADAAHDAAPTAKEGQVFIAEAHSPAEIATAFAMFLNGPLLAPTGSADGCLTMPNTSGASLSAGSIDITGTTEPLMLVQDDPGDVYTTTTLPPTDLFSAGDTLTVTASGDEVPAFTATVDAPAPLANVGFPASLSRSAPATVTWTAGTANAVWLLLNSATVTEGALLCRTTDTGSFTMTPAALALLPSGVTKATFIMYRLDETEKTAGAWTIYVRAADGQVSGALDINP